MFQYVEKLKTSARTLVYPEEVREAVRQRFGDPDAGAYDRQYTDKVFTILHIWIVHIQK